jgi:hypothetical protein
MSALLKTGLLCMACLLPLVAYGQEQADVPLGVLPMQYNGSFAGETGSPRLNTLVGWSYNRYFAKNYRTYASYDQFIPALRSGVGLTAGYGRTMYGGERFGRGYAGRGYGAYFSAAIAPKFSMGGKLTLSPSLDLALYSGGNTFTHPQIQLRQEYRGSTIRSRVGLLLNTEKFYAGYSVHLVDRFNTYSENDTASLRTAGRTERFTSYWQFGYTFGRGTESKFSFTPQLVFTTGTRQYARRRFVLFSPADFNLNFRYKKVIWGLNTTGVHVGWQTDKLRIMLSDNLQYVRRQDPGYAANLALRYIFKE